ncbi:MAG: ATP-binding cassette domain-containing protein [Prevotella sp.]|nr:ATP-binding cassette domain-containing protein [Prevotella sp.]
MDSTEATGQGKITVIYGLNASGKTQMAERMRREMKSDSVRYVAFCDTYGTATDRSYYLQQRWNQHDIDEETPTVAQALERSFLLSGPDTTERRQLQRHLYDLMGMEPLLDKVVIALSSGELRKMQLVKTLMANPKTLILDNPFIGLDIEARDMLSEQLQQLRQQGMTLYLLIARPNEIPEYADEVRGERREVRGERLPAQTVISHTSHLSPLTTKEVVLLRDVTIRYGSRTILDHLSWTICQGEHWALQGRNGSGKSTLLSLICADNPQSYACDITLFGHQRGSGESIWDIKRRIGYVSPELHRSYQRNLPALSIVASGLKDTVGLYVRATEEDKQLCLQWMRRFGIDQLAQRSFMQLSSGEQRLVLVCRAFVKSPDLLILDEPMHGLDMPRQQLVKDIINDYCRDPQKTLIMVTHYDQELPSCINRRKIITQPT